MKFGRKFEQSKIPEWADFYVSYKLLKKLLSPFNALKKVYLRSTINNNTISIHNFSQEEITQLDQFSKAFETIIFEDLEKVLVFYTQQLSQVISKWKKIRINMMIFKERRDALSKNAREQQFSMLKQAYQVLLRELKLMSDYITVNLEAFQKIIKKYHKAVKLFYPKDTLKIRLEKYLLETRIFIMRDRLNNFLSSVESEYVDAFYKNKVEGVNALRKIAQGSLISKNETFFFGLFSGFTALLLILIILLCIEEGADVDEDQVMKEIFPMFRGMAIIIAYMGLLAWNVYGWTKYNVNYKLIFRFNHHYSQLSQILKRGAIFATILLLLVLWYLLLDADLGDISKGLDFIPKEVLPLILWISFIFYVFFPSFKIFNGPGRKYMFYMLKLVLKTPFVPVTFIIIWATDQLASFVLPLKDTEYTICYYIAYFFYDHDAILNCTSSKRFTKSVIMAIVPLVLRILQCLRQVYDNHHGRRDPLLNTGKYTASLITSILSYMVTVSGSETRYLVAWIVFAAISTIYSFGWDLKKDWDFLQPNTKYRFLRDQLSYRNPVFYYMAISGNLLMRLAWVLSISPDIISQIMRPELFSFIIGFVEVFRRSVWNFLRVEKEHLANVGSFRAVPALVLPYNDIVFNDQTKQDYFNTELEKIMHNNNKSEKPISVGSYLPYRTSLVSVAENYNRLDKPASKINLQFASTNMNEVNIRSISAIPFKATAFGTMDEKEKEQLLKDLYKYREEEKSRYKRWIKEIDNFKQLLKLRQSKFVVIDVDNEPLIFQEIDTKKNGSPVKKENKNLLQEGFKLKVIEENPEIYRTDLESSAHGKIELKLEAPKIAYQTHESLLQTEEDRAETLTTDPDAPIIRKSDRIPTKTVKKVLGDVLSQEKSLWAQDQDTDGVVPSRNNLDGSTSFRTKFEETPRTDYRQLNNEKNHQFSLDSVDDTNTNRDNKVYLALESPQNTQHSPLHFKADHELMSLPSSAGRSSDDNNLPAFMMPNLAKPGVDEIKTQKETLITSIEDNTKQIHVRQSPRKIKSIKPAVSLSDGKTSTGQSSGSD